MKTYKGMSRAERRHAEGDNKTPMNQKRISSYMTGYGEGSQLGFNYKKRGG